MDTPFFSIIVPIYNVGEYLLASIKSVLSQSCKDYELILVDDGSPDKCPQICDEYAARYPQVQAIHKVMAVYQMPVMLEWQFQGKIYCFFR